MKFSSNKSNDEKSERPSWMAYSDFIYLRELQKLGPKTKFELLSIGVKLSLLEKLEKYGILTKEYNSFNNLTYYKVCDDIFRGEKG